MKLLVDTKSQRVLYAEASKDVVDFLFSLLALPVGAAVELLGKESMAGCVGNVYASVEALDDAYVQPGAAKDALLHPTALSPAAAAGAAAGSLLRLPAPPPPPDPPSPKKLFRCTGGDCYRGSMFSASSGTSCRDYATDRGDLVCSSCRGQMNKEVTLLSSAEPEQMSSAGAAAGGESGFVRGVVAPMSTISGITLLNTFGVTDIGILQHRERTVQLGYAEGLDILRVSLQSRKVLTDVFLGKKRKA
ncbi:hypothetical protein PVAP13_5NG083800 [Panicum virgatum]|uniref:Uncharacterized protein n=1 Tax=Panicum virgatum TaxID=38727 RepID=A0A8T0RQ14_PANVG|nr:hypothetical protein PVAP13_5NG083800 [Panicum virgatum]